MNTEQNIPLEFVPLVEGCEAHGIRRSMAFRLAREGILETFKIGKRRYVLVSSLKSLPRKMQESVDSGESV